MTPRAVFDCMVLLQAAARATGPAAACLRAVRAGRLELFLSPDILSEVRDVLTRPKTLRKFPALYTRGGGCVLAGDRELGRDALRSAEGLCPGP